jgi:hypothetical protein
MNASNRSPKLRPYHGQFASLDADEHVEPSALANLFHQPAALAEV